MNGLCPTAQKYMNGQQAGAVDRQSATLLGGN